MKRYFAPLLLLVILTLLACPAYSGLVVNEVMSNEPGSSTSLEWFELYNDSSAVAYLALYQIQVGGATIRLNEALDPYEYVVVCRKLYSDETSAGFEGVWGDSSGTWDNEILEESYREPIVASFPILTNSGGTISIINSSLVQVSYLSWNNVGADGVSWERVSSSQNLVGQSTETNGATPGYVNSITPLSNDLALVDVSAASLGGSTKLSFTVKNTGTLTSPAGQVTAYYDDPSDPGTYNSVVRVFEYPALLSGDTAKYSTELILDGVYAQLRVEIADDDRLRNNIVSFVAPGELFPPVVLSEILANPQGTLGTEWIEIKSISSELIDLAGWTISDEVSAHEISTGSLTIESDNYVVLADDTSLFTDYYMPPDNDPVQPPTWPILNNDGDVVVLTDNYGIEADRFEFTAPFDSNYSWSRVEPVDYNGRWGRSENMGGSPGQTNRVVLVTEGSSIAINIQPKIFSPNDDWVDETTVLTVEAPESDEYTLEIYDRQGRVVKTFMDKEPFLRVEYEWDGYSDDGKRLPIGIYIVYFEAAGIESIKETVVIAR